jgi:hypothetical protein
MPGPYTSHLFAWPPATSFSHCSHCAYLRAHSDTFVCVQVCSMPPRPSLNTTNSSKASSQSQQQEVLLVPKSGFHKQAPAKVSTSQTKQPPIQPRKVSSRSSKPILNWFQRKLGGTTKTGRQDVAPPRGANSTIKGRSTLTSRDCVVSGPIETLADRNSNSVKMDTVTPVRRKTISLNEGDDGGATNSDGEHDGQSVGSSVARDSAWSPASALEADDDASVRPLPPSAPPSPSPSRSSSSQLSDPRTFKSLAASTKPTTLLSVDLPPHGMAHIAQVPTTTLTQVTRLPSHTRTSSGGSGAMVGSGTSITFSALPPSSSPSSVQHSTTNPPSPQTPNGPVTSIQAPLHTTHHPRNNPRPSSPPMDNASMLTLASSAFAVPGSRMGIGLPGWSSAAHSAMGADSISQFGSITGEGDPDVDAESTSHDILEDYERGDVDASVRALRPRSSRRGSWDSEASGWSARVGGGPITSPSLATRSLWTSNSVQTGGQVSADNDEDEGSRNGDRDEPASSQSRDTHSIHSKCDAAENQTTSKINGLETQLKDSDTEVVENSSSVDVAHHPMPLQSIQTNEETTENDSGKLELTEKEMEDVQSTVARDD